MKLSEIHPEFLFLVAQALTTIGNCWAALGANPDFALCALRCCRGPLHIGELDLALVGRCDVGLRIYLPLFVAHFSKHALPSTIPSRLRGHVEAGKHVPYSG